MRSGIFHHKSDRKSCVKPTADRNKRPIEIDTQAREVIDSTPPSDVGGNRILNPSESLGGGGWVPSLFPGIDCQNVSHLWRITSPFLKNYSAFGVNWVQIVLNSHFLYTVSSIIYIVPHYITCESIL